MSATQFIDCSGDSILRLSGAAHRWGREDREAYGESLAVEQPDRKTMGNTLLIQLREIAPKDHRPFIPPSFALKLDDNHPRANRFQPKGHNFWWLEVGGEMDTIGDSDSIRDELYGIAYGVWDFIKNHPDGVDASGNWSGSEPCPVNGKTFVTLEITPYGSRILIRWANLTTSLPTVAGRWMIIRRRLSIISASRQSTMKPLRPMGSLTAASTAVIFQICFLQVVIYRPLTWLCRPPG